MSSFNPLGSAADSHPLTAARTDLPFHHDDDDDDAWTPPSLPGETRNHPTSGAGGAGGRTNGVGGSGRSSRLPLDPLQSDGGDSFGNGRDDDDDDGAAAEEESYSRAVNANHRSSQVHHKSGSNGGITRNIGVAGGGRRERERGLPATATTGGPMGKAAVGAGMIGERTDCQAPPSGSGIGWCFVRMRRRGGSGGCTTIGCCLTVLLFFISYLLLAFHEFEKVVLTVNHPPDSEGAPLQLLEELSPDVLWYSSITCRNMNTGTAPHEHVRDGGGGVLKVTSGARGRKSLHGNFRLMC